MMRMLDFDALRTTHQLEAEIARQRERLLADGIVSENELAAVKPYLLVWLFASPLGVRMLAAQELHREWAFTYRRETETGAQLLPGRDRLLLHRARRVGAGGLQDRRGRRRGDRAP